MMMKTNIEVKNEPMEIQVHEPHRPSPPPLTQSYPRELFQLVGFSLPTRPSDLETSSLLPSTCAWCQKSGNRSFTVQTETGQAKSLCSEVCFNHYRRASFKKNKHSETEGRNKSKPLSDRSLCEKRTKTPSHPLQSSLIDPPRRKLLLPVHHVTPPSKRLCLPSTTEKISPHPPPFNFVWPSPCLSPPAHLVSTLFKGTSASTITCLLPTFIPLPIPIPIPIPLPLPCRKCSASHQVTHVECQTE